MQLIFDRDKCFIYKKNQWKKYNFIRRGQKGLLKKRPIFFNFLKFVLRLVKLIRWWMNLVKRFSCCRMWTLSLMEWCRLIRPAWTIIRLAAQELLTSPPTTLWCILVLRDRYIFDTNRTFSKPFLSIKLGREPVLSDWEIKFSRNSWVFISFWQFTRLIPCFLRFGFILDLK